LQYPPPPPPPSTSTTRHHPPPPCRTTDSTTRTRGRRAWTMARRVRTTAPLARRRCRP
jgi:hypothetical protein